MVSFERADFKVDAKQLHAGLLGSGFAEMAIQPAHLFAAGALPWHHRDPFDRLLLAQAKVESAVLLTADRGLKAYGAFVRTA